MIYKKEYLCHTFIGQRLYSMKYKELYVIQT